MSGYRAYTTNARGNHSWYNRARVRLSSLPFLFRALSGGTLSAAERSLSFFIAIDSLLLTGSSLFTSHMLLANTSLSYSQQAPKPSRGVSCTPVNDSENILDGNFTDVLSNILPTPSSPLPPAHSRCSIRLLRQRRTYGNGQQFYTCC